MTVSDTSNIAPNMSAERQTLNQPWKAWYQPAPLPKSGLSFVWPITLASFASGNGAKSMVRDVNFDEPKAMESKETAESVVAK